MDIASTNILVVDDDAMVLSAMRRRIEQLRPQSNVTTVSDPAKALLLSNSVPFDLVISDLRMPRIDGSVVLRQVRRGQPLAVRAVLSGQATTDLLLSTLPLSHVYLEKPCSTERLLGVLDVLDAIAQSKLPRTLLRHLLNLTTLPADGGSLLMMQEAIAAQASDRHIVRLLRSDLAVQVVEFRLASVVGGGFRISDDALALSPELLLQMTHSRLVSPVVADHAFMLSLRALAIKARLLADTLRRKGFQGDAHTTALAAYLGELGILSFVGASSELLQRLLPYRCEVASFLAALWGFPTVVRQTQGDSLIQATQATIDEILPYSEVEQLSASVLLEILSEVLCSVDG